MFKWQAFVVMLLSVGVASPGAWALQDPTKPPDFVAPAERKSQAPQKVYTLESIVFSPNRRIAVINGEALAEGERLGRLLVQRIREDAVVVRIGQQSRTLKLASPPVVRSP